MHSGDWCQVTVRGYKEEELYVGRCVDRREVGDHDALYNGFGSPAARDFLFHQPLEHVILRVQY